MPKGNTIMVESGKWLSKNKQRVKHPRTPNNTFSRTKCQKRSKIDESQMTITGLWRKGTDVKKTAANKENVPLSQDRKRINDEADYRLPNKRQKVQVLGVGDTCCDCRDTTTYSNGRSLPYLVSSVSAPTNNKHSQMNNAVPVTKPRGLLLGEQESPVLPQQKSPKVKHHNVTCHFEDNPSSINQQCHTGTSAEHNRVTDPSTQELTELSANFCPKETSTQLLDIDSSEAALLPTEPSAICDHDESTRDQDCIPSSSYPDFDSTHQYSLSMRFTEDSQGNQIFCRLSPKKATN